MSQTTTPTTRTAYREGQIAERDGVEQIASGVASAALAYGLLLQRGTGERVYKPMDALPAADADAIVTTSLTTTATAQLFSGGDFDGVVGAGLVPGYSQRLSFTLNNHADWLATVLKVCYEGPDGAETIEDIAIPAGGNTVLYSVGVASIVKWVYLPAQGGTNGTMDIGLDPTQPYLGIDRRVFAGVGVYVAYREPYTDTTEVEANASFSLMEKGRVAVVVEKAITTIGQPAYVRVVTSGADVRGQWQGEPDTNFVRVPGANFRTLAGVDGIAVLELGGM